MIYISFFLPQVATINNFTIFFIIPSRKATASTVASENFAEVFLVSFSKKAL